MIPLELAVKLRTLRNQKGLTLREVAGKIGVSAGYLSQLESGKVGASFSTLLKLTHFYGENMSDLLWSVENPDKPIVSRAENRRAIESAEGIYIEWLVSNSESKMEVDIITVGSGGSGGESYSHEGEEFCFVLKGIIKFSIGEQEYVLSEGDLIYFSSEMPHTWVNVAESEGKILFCTTPPTV